MSLLEQLKSRERPSLDYELPVGDVARASRRLAEEREGLRAAKARVVAAEAAVAAAATAEDPQAAEAAASAELEAAQEAAEDAWEAVTRADASLASCYAHIKLVAMEPQEFEALLAEYPPRPGTDDKRYDAAALPKACFLACATELTEEEWEPILKANLSYAERDDLYTLAVAVNERLVNVALPKGSMPIRPS